MKAAAAVWIVLVLALAGGSYALAAGTATLTLDRSSGPTGTPVTATYTAPGCGSEVAATVAFSLDGITGPQFGTSSMNTATCSATLKFAVSAAPGAHQIFAYVPNSGAPVASAQFTVLAPQPAPQTTPVSPPTPVPTQAPSPSPSQTPSPSPVAARSAGAGTGLSDFLLPLLIGIILVLLALLVVLLVLLRRSRARNASGSGPAQPPSGG